MATAARSAFAIRSVVAACHVCYCYAECQSTARSINHWVSRRERGAYVVPARPTGLTVVTRCQLTCCEARHI